MGKLVQYAGSVIIANLCMCLGVMFTWPSSTYRLFESTNTTLHRPMTDTELALFGSVSSVGALVATPVCGVYLDQVGRKNMSILACVMGVISWAMIAASSRVEVLLTAMFVSGFNGSVFLVVPVFISEICEQSIRGAMTSCTMIFYGVGMLVSYLLGGYLSYHTMVYVCLTMTVGTTASLFFLRESPTCLMIQGKEKEAAESLAFYRGVKSNSKQVEEELNAIRKSLNPEMDDITPEEEKQLKPEELTEQPKEKMGLLRFLRKSKSTRSAFYMIMIMVTSSIFQGLVVVQVYAEPLFEEAVPSMSPNVASILMVIVAIFVGVVAAYLTEVAGRRPLAIYASFATAASCLFLGLQLHLRWGPNWLVAVTIYLFTTAYTLGGGTVPFVLIAEVFLPEVKSIMSTVVIEWTWFCNSVILFIFNPLLKAMGLGPVFYLFASVSALTGVYAIFFVPETKGLSVEAIQDKLTKKKKRTDIEY